MTAPGIPNELVLSTSCFGNRLQSIEDQAFHAVAMGFRKIELGLLDDPVTVHGFEDTQRETGVEVVSVMAGCLKPFVEDMPSTRLGSTDEDIREQGLLSVRRHVRLAQQFGAPVVVLRGGTVEDPDLHGRARELEELLRKVGPEEEVRDQVVEYAKELQNKSQVQIEHFCRCLHEVAKEFPDTRLAIEPGVQLTDLMHFEAVGWVLSDLERQGLGYWHHVGRIFARERAGLPPQGQWLDTYGPRMLGVHLMDASSEEVGLPPGSGEVDFKLIGSYLNTEISRVVEVSPKHGRAEILASVRFLVDQGLG